MVERSLTYCSFAYSALACFFAPINSVLSQIPLL
jgi:hypothetical protein